MHLYVPVDAFAAGRSVLEIGRFLSASGSAHAAAQATWLHSCCEGARTPGLVGLEGPLPLTPRETEVANLAATGLSSRDIAARLTLSVRTVENHRQAVYAKLGVTGRRDLPAILTPTGRPGQQHQAGPEDPSGDATSPARI